jgi:hypothetical protein
LRALRLDHAAKGGLLTKRKKRTLADLSFSEPIILSRVGIVPP